MKSSNTSRNDLMLKLATPNDDRAVPTVDEFMSSVREAVSEALSLIADKHPLLPAGIQGQLETVAEDVMATSQGTR